MTMSTQDALASLKSEDCPGCGGFKRNRKSVCSMCWSKLPSRLRSPLFKMVGKGYEKGITEAVVYLSKDDAS